MFEDIFHIIPTTVYTDIQISVYEDHIETAIECNVKLCVMEVIDKNIDKRIKVVSVSGLIRNINKFNTLVKLNRLNNILLTKAF